MDEVDVDDADDLNELEARLYAQIHHEPSDGCNISSSYKEASPVRLVTPKSVINNKPVNRAPPVRYWNNKKLASSDVTQSVEQIAPPDANGEINKQQPAETVDKSFPPLVKNLSDLRVNPFASGTGPKAKGSSSQQVHVSKHVNPLNPKSKKNPQNDSSQGPFARQITKLSNAIKYEAKKQKAKIAKSKVVQKPSTTATTISTTTPQISESIVLLSSNESETDDVIEVPLPPPTILTIESSSDDDEIVAEDKTDFVMPQSSNGKDNPSRCTSPSSVMSDDFIGQNDRSRLEQEQIMADDEDIVLLQENMDSLMEKPDQSAELSSDSFVAPVRNRTTSTSIADYRVTQNEFRALDVYESESDIQESVYSKGMKRNKNSVIVRLEHESSSDDDIEEIDITQKTKRLRKRRASSANKDTETIVDSTDSERENQIENEHSTATRIPHIARGEAIERYVTKEPTPSKLLANSSDNEFIATLTNLAQGTPIDSISRAIVSDEDDEDDEQEQITARAIAEDVIKKEMKTQNKKKNQAEEDAIPSSSLIELDEVFEKIDNLDNVKKPENYSCGSDDSVELVPPLPVPRRLQIAKGSVVKVTNDPIYNIVYSGGKTHFTGIGWNEEMKRFYGSSWRGEHFNVKALCSQMKTTKSLWKIYSEDRNPRGRKNPKMKCMNCCEFGHTRAKCTQPKKVPVCYMCGEQGHREPRCPHTVCLRCGNKTRMFTKSCNACNYQNRLICPICKIRGHNLNFCPDKWRRYHSTTIPNEYPDNQIEYKNRKFCCVCGCRGHWAEHCKNSINFSEYPVFVSDVRSHQKSYDDIPVKTIRSGIGYNLMYKPQKDICFELASQSSKNHVYGRFLLAVGLGHMLQRKRRMRILRGEQPSKNKQQKMEKGLKDYVVNPFAKAILEKSSVFVVKNKNTTSSSLITDQIIDLDTEDDQSEADKCQQTVTSDEPTNGDIEMTTNATQSSIADARLGVPTSNIQPNEDTSEKEPNTTFKTPNTSLANPQTPKGPEPLEVMDSDSNYSFSDHFEAIKPTPTQPPEQEVQPKSKAREMGPLPDFIPINDDSYTLTDEDTAGISKPFVPADTDDENSIADSTPIPDIPCEAKVYLSAFHSKFLLSPEGNKYLIEKSKTLNVEARLKLSSVGHVLLLFGNRVDQDRFHAELLHKFRELSDQLNRKQLENSQKVPRRKEVLIRFLREHISQLLTNLGNANDVYKRLRQQENQHTKAGWKLAERTRRLLNMILIGQAGLRNGSLHLDNLLTHLRNLIDNFRPDVVPNDIRDDIDANWKLIFSSHRHDKYDELIDLYNHMQTKNRLQLINIDPRLLGKKMLDTSLSKSQKDKMDKPPSGTPDSTGEQVNISKLVPNPISSKHQPRTSRTSLDKKHQRSNSMNSSLPSLNDNIQLNLSTSEIVFTPGVTKIRAVSGKWEKTCVNLLTELDNNGKGKKGTPTRDSKATSMFWSREAMKYIHECMELGRTNASLIEKLTRVQKKSQKGLLSFNDYRAIIKIHNAMKGKQ